MSERLLIPPDHDAETARLLRETQDSALVYDSLAALRAENAAIKAAARALLDALPQCLDPGCSEPAVYGVLSHEPELCSRHAVGPRGRVHSKRADWADEAEELWKAVEG